MPSPMGWRDETIMELTPESQLEELFQAVSNWGRWGPDDELGTLNHITPSKVAGAARLVSSGRIVSLAHELDTRWSEKNYNPAVHRMLYLAHEAPVTAVDELTIVPHSFTVTHLDAIAHANFDGRLYNGRSAGDVVTREGLSFGSIHAQRNGIVTRGVLLDIAAVRGVEWLEPGDYVTPDDLDAAAADARVEIAAGDAVLVRVGLAAREAATGPEDVRYRAGLTPDCLKWLHRNDVAVYGGDCFERLPLPYERHPWAFHEIGLAAMGLVLLDNANVEALAEAVRQEGRSEFLLSIAPLPIPRATGSAVNPLAIF